MKQIINEKTQDSILTGEEDSPSEIVRIDFGNLKRDLGGFVRGTVEEALNGLLEAEAESLCGAKRYERGEGRQGHRSGHYRRNLETVAGKVSLKMPKLCGLTFETQIIERYRRREASVEESLVVSRNYATTAPVRKAGKCTLPG